ncbi:MAG: hypothetical protein ACK5PZ_04145 [Pirellula sp.]
MQSNTRFSCSTLKKLRWSVHVAGTLIMVGAVLAAWKSHSLTKDWYTSIEEEIQGHAQALRDVDKIESQLQESLQSRDHVATSFRSMRDRVPVRLIDSDILGQLEKVVEACNCTLNDFRPAGNEMINTPDLKCKVRSFQLSMNGTYASLFELVSELEALPFLLEVTKLHVLAPSDGKRDSRIELEIGILYSPEWGESVAGAEDRA